VPISEQSLMTVKAAYRRLGLVSLFLFVVSVVIIASWGINATKHDFRHDALRIAEVVSKRLNENNAALQGLGALYHAMDEVGHNQFYRYAQQMLDSYPQIVMVAYHVRVDAQDLRQFEREHRAKGFFGFQVREKTSGLTQAWEPVAQREFYYPMVYVHPSDSGFSELWGFDAYSDPVLRAAMDKAISSGQIVASAPMRLVNGKQGYVLFKTLKAKSEGFKSVGVNTAETDPQDLQAEVGIRIISIQVEAMGILDASVIVRPSTQISILYRGAEGERPLLQLGSHNSVRSIWPTTLSYEQLLQNKGHNLVLQVSEPLSLNALGLGAIFIAASVIALLTIMGFMRIRYVQERKKSQHFIDQQRVRSEAALHSIGDAVITCNYQGQVEHMNRMAEKLTGWQLDEARGKPLQEVFRIVDELSGGTLIAPVDKCIQEGRVVRLEESVVLQSKAEDTSLIETGASPIRGPQGQVIGAVLVFHDISKEREMEDRIAYQASHDSLTALFDRGEFERQLHNALESAKASQAQHALCYMDIDQFKVVNDTCGYDAGDELLVQLSALLLSTVRNSDILARLGGDEFAILLMDCPLELAENKAEALRELVKEFQFIWQGKRFDVSFGIGVVPINESSGSTTDVLCAADAVCYAAKSRGRNQIFVYQSDDPELAKRRGEMRWARRIGEALQNHHFQLYYQTIEPIGEPEPKHFHCELLMRTEDGGGELVSPEEFIPAAERFNLMTDIDRWVVNTSLPMIARLHQQCELRGESILCGINLSGQSLGDESFLSYVKDLLAAYQVPASSLCFEITETSAIANFDVALRFIEVMRQQGCVFALDDFGTGVSSFTYLKKLPVDYVKIDGSFVRCILDNEVDLAMVESINRIAHVMGIKTVAEFVEDAAILERLREMDVDYAQGYEIARPAPLADKLASLSR
jgi:diguanylate cyclase (GGDEF)-like protein/PAS domain S-box-containing protein